jgi:DNA-binding GntR family transcriptional regulator
MSRIASYSTWIVDNGGRPDLEVSNLRILTRRSLLDQKLSQTESTEVLCERIAKSLSDRIIRGVYEPGERLIEAALSEEFEVSHGPIRDALRILDRIGLVTINSYRGAQVTEVSVREVQDLYQVRSALVGIRARWIAEDANRAEILRKVEGPVARLIKLAEHDKEAEAFVNESFVVNNILTDSLSNRWLRSTIQALTLQTSRYSRLALLASGQRRRESAHLWQMLLDAMAAGEGDLAERVAEVLSLSARDAAVKYLIDAEAVENASELGIKIARLK